MSTNADSSAAQPTDSVPVTEGFAPFVVGDETYQTWFKIFGMLDGRAHRPLLVVHGGPGLTHEYVLPHQDVAGHGIPVVFYDQVGNGRSTRLPDKPRAFWTIEFFIDELLNLTRHLGFEDDFDIVGHSWGAMLGAELVIRRHPKGLKHLVLANSLPAMSLWNKSEGMLLPKFPKEVLDGFEKPPTDPAFRKAFDLVQAKHGCNVQPFPEEFVRSIDASYGVDGDKTVREAMFVPGRLSDWDIRDKLHHIDVPSLVINGVDDFAQDFVVEPFFRFIPKAKWVRFEKSSHTPFWEERERYNQVVRSFVDLTF